MRIVKVILAGMLLALPLLSIASPAQAALRNCERTVFVTATTRVTIPSDSAAHWECVMAQGNRSSAVSALQQALNRCYGKALATDGIFGPATRTALIQVQRVIGAAADGVYGPQTGKRLVWPIHNSAGVYLGGCRDAGVF